MSIKVYDDFYEIYLNNRYYDRFLNSSSGPDIVGFGTGHSDESRVKAIYRHVKVRKLKPMTLPPKSNLNDLATYLKDYHKIDPHPHHIIELVEVLFKNGQIVEGERLIDDVLAHKTDNWAYHCFNIGLAYMRVFEHEKALSYFQRCQDTLSNKAGYHEWYSKLALELSRLDTQYHQLASETCDKFYQFKKIRHNDTFQHLVDLHVLHKAYDKAAQTSVNLLKRHKRMRKRSGHYVDVSKRILKTALLPRSPTGSWIFAQPTQRAYRIPKTALRWPQAVFTLRLTY